MTVVTRIDNVSATQYVAQFEKVSATQFAKDWGDNFYRTISEHQKKFPDESLRSVYEGIKLPVRATSGSAGYDFSAPYSFEIDPGEAVTIATGIKVKICDGWCLLLIPRSSLGFKHSAHLANTVGLIDSDYYSNPTTEGHIMAKIVNAGKEKLYISRGVRLIQGIFVNYGQTLDDNVAATRAGGFGSTGV